MRKGDAMIHRGIATIAVALALCFLLLSHFDPQFFLIHFYESLIYLAIVLMLFYFEDRWAYMMGIVAPSIWLALTAIWNGIPTIGRQITDVFHPESAFFYTDLLTAGALTLSVAMIVCCANRWRNEFAGLRKGWSTLLVSTAIAAAYYAVVVVWILRWPPSAS
jgi:hypothetical protein